MIDFRYFFAYRRRLTESPSPCRHEFGHSYCAISNGFPFVEASLRKDAVRTEGSIDDNDRISLA
jgi:hypothetical protein